MDDPSLNNAAQEADESLTGRMRRRTWDLHRRAERGGVIAAILAGTVTLSGYALYLRNLLPAYEAMETGLSNHARTPVLGMIARQTPTRVASLIEDLTAIEGSDWRRVLPLLPAGERYAARVTAAADKGDGALLLAHVYTRCLGDLNGGRILRRHLIRRFGETFHPLAFTAFPGIVDIPAFTSAFRATLDDSGRHVSDQEAVIREAEAAFVLNIELSEDVFSHVKT